MASGQENTTGWRTFQATAAALEAYVRVDVDSSGLISVAGATDRGIGVTTEAIAASGYGTVKLFSAPGTFIVQAAAAVTRGAALYGAADGEIDDTGTYDLNLLALEAATAQGDVIECVLADGRSAVPAPYSSADVGTVAAAGNSQGTAGVIAKLVTYVSAADGTKGVVLPAASAGLVYEVYNVAAAVLKLYPGSGDDINDGAGDAAVSMAAKTHARCIAVDAATWAVIFTAG
jgi:hypothetical protein